MDSLDGTSTKEPEQVTKGTLGTETHVFSAGLTRMKLGFALPVSAS